MTYEAHEGYRYGCRCEACESKRDADAEHFAKYLQEYNNSAECKDAFDALFARKTTPHLP